MRRALGKCSRGLPPLVLCTICAITPLRLVSQPMSQSTQGNAKHAAAGHAAKKPPNKARKVLSQFTTHFDPSNAKRAHNIRLAALRLNGKVIAPGQVFSLNRVVGERTHKNGFLTAPVIEEGKKVPGIGGGVSQIAGTLFNAALLAGLTVKEYQNHARPVQYLPVGRDATVAWNLIDLKIKNDTPSPVVIKAHPRGGRLTVVVLGIPVPGRKIGLAVHKKKVTPTHVETDLYRVIKRAGKTIRKERIGHADYNWRAENPD